MSVLGLFLLGQSYFDRQVSALSGGEKSRLVLASLFLKRCNFLLLDEPTNHLDLESREALARALENFDGTLLMVAHDRWLLSQVGAEAWELDSRGITVHADFAAYDAARKARLAGTPASAVLRLDGGQNIARDVAPSAPQNRPLSRDDQKRRKREEAAQRNALHKALKPLQDRYAALEAELARVLEEQGAAESELADPEVYADHARSGELLRRFEECRARSETLVEEMAGLESDQETIRARYGAGDA